MKSRRIRIAASLAVLAAGAALAQEMPDIGFRSVGRRQPLLAKVKDGKEECPDWIRGAGPAVQDADELTLYGFRTGSLPRDYRPLPRDIFNSPDNYAFKDFPAAEFMNLMAEEGLRALADASPRIRRQGTDLEARSQALYGSWLCAIVLGTVGVALHHKLCHTLGGSFNLPHEEVHSVVLPHAIAPFDAPAVPQALEHLSRALGGAHAPGLLYDLARDQGAPYCLKAIGMQEADLDKAADIASANPYWNPRPVERAGIRALLQKAFDGARPE